MNNYVEMQRVVEETYSKRRINQLIRDELLSDESMLQLRDRAATALTEYINGEYYQSKMLRLSRLKELNPKTLVMDIMVCLQRLLGVPTKLTAMVGQTARSLGFNDAKDGITTAAEMIAICAQQDVCDIDRTEDNELLVVPVYVPGREVTEEIRRCKFLPPMLCEPLELKSNWGGGLLTEKESVLLGKGTHHDGELVLDHLNRMNRVPLCLNTEFLKSYSEAPTFALDTEDKKEQWKTFMQQSYRVYLDLVKQGNCFWPRHAYDSRGRTYMRGYHVNYQGSQFKKAMVDLYHKETIDVPEEYRL